MATKINDTKRTSVFIWTIPSYRQLFESSFCLYSPLFTALRNKSSSQQIQWRLMIKPVYSNREIYLCRFDDVENEYDFKCSLVFVNNDSVCWEIAEKSWKNKIRRWTQDHNRMYSFDKSPRMTDLFPDNNYFHHTETITLRCTIWPTEAKPETTDLCFAFTNLLQENDYFIWPIENFSSLQMGQERTLVKKPNLSKVSFVTLKLLWAEDGNLQINIAWQDPADSLSTIWEISIINGVGETVKPTTEISVAETVKKILQVTLPSNKSELMAERNLNLPNDVLILKFCCSKAFSSKILFNSRQNEQLRASDTENLCISDTAVEKYITGTLTQDMKNLFKDGLFSDFNFIVGSQKFPVHKAVLSARSSMFKAMFTTDMKEKNQTSLELSDINEKTLKQLLLYIYTDTINEQQFEDSAALYSAADKFGLISLKNECSSLLKANICVSNACEILLLSDMHSDENLKIFTQDFIFDNGAKILRSDTWKNFRKDHTFLASETAEYIFLKGN